jgi:NADH-quinone oxidoreductase subunit C
VEARLIFDRAAVHLGEAVFGFQAPVPIGAPSPAGAPDGKAPDPKPADAGPVGRDAFFRVRPERIADLCVFLRDEPELRFDFLQSLTAVDWPKRDVQEIVYHLFSYRHRHSLCVKADVPRGAPRLPSVAAIWPTANWQEREQFDLLGVVFEGHPDLRRILMPDDWVGHPMRKDFHEPKSYRGMPTSRPSPLELLRAYDRAHPKDDPGIPGGDKDKAP